MGERKQRPARQLKLSIADEAAVVGAALVDRGTRRRAAALLRPADILDEKLRLLFEVALQMDARNLEWSEDVVASLAGAEHPERWGGYAFLRQLVGDYGAGALPNLDHHVERIHATNFKQALVNDLAAELVRFAEDPHAEVAEAAGLLGRWKAKADKLGRVRTSDAVEVMDRTIARIRAAREGAVVYPGLCCPAFDACLALGLRPGKASVIGGKPRAGKSTLTVMGTLWRALQGHGTCYVTTESEEEDVGLMMASAHLGLDYLGLVRGALDEESTARATDFCERLRVRGLFEVVPNPFDVIDFRTSDPKKRVKRGFGDRNEANLRDLDRIVASTQQPLVVVDLFATAVPEQKPEFLDEALQAVKQIAAAHRKHVMLVHHIKRSQAEPGRSEPRPSLDQLRGTGGWEQFMDTILIVDRPRLRLKGRAAPEEDTFVVEFAKQKDAPLARVAYRYDGPTRALRDPRIVPHEGESLRVGQTNGDADDQNQRRDPLDV